MDKTTGIEVKPTNQDFAYWLNRPYVDASLRLLLSDVNLLIVPREDYPGYNGPIFPQGTDQILDFLKENSPNNIIPEVCISDEDYFDLTLHHDLLNLGTFVVEHFIAPVAVVLVVNYLNKRHTGRADIKVTFTVVDTDSQSKQITYEGPADQLSTIMIKALETKGAEKDVPVLLSAVTKQVTHEPQSDQEISTGST